MAFSDLISSVSDITGDLTSLNVETFTGKLIVRTDKPGEIDWDKMFESSQTGTGAVEGEVELLMASKFSADGDARLFISRSEISPTVEQAHHSAVVAGSEIRAEIMDFLKDLIIPTK